MTSTLVVGYDGSAASRAALAVAARLGAGGRLVVVHAHSPSAPHVTAHWRELLQESVEERSRALLADLPAEASGALAGVAVEHRSEDGAPADALLRVADDVAADAVVVGSRGYDETAGLVGSVSAQVLRRSARPVLVIPPNYVATSARG